MSDYEGRNLPQLIELMHDLARPEAVSWLPQTVGWWVIGAWLLVLAFLGVGYAYLHWRRNRYRREAITLLQAIETGAVAGTSLATAGEKIAVLLKRTALVAYSRAEVASLHGSAWADFLCVSCNYDPVVERAAVDLAGAAYRRDANSNGDALFAAARRWIEVHRA